MKKNKVLKAARNAHTANTKHGMGDYYGTGIKNPVGKIRSVMGFAQSTPKSLKKPPKSLA